MITDKAKEWAVGIIVPIIAFILLAIAFAVLGSECPKEREAVKCLVDDKGVNFNATPSTIHAECALPRPKGNWLTLSRQSSESQAVRIKGEIVAFGLEADNDFHLVLSDGKESMICEIPKPECANPKYAEYFKNARAWVVSHCGVPGRIKSIKPVPCTIEGLGFFDKIAHGKGHAPNGREIHPCLKIQ